MNSLNGIVEYYRGTGRGLATSRLSFEPGSTRLELGDNRKDIDSALLHDADRLTKAAMASYMASNCVQMGGHSTWGEITLYYSQFQVITALLRLTGIGRVYRRSVSSSRHPGKPTLLLRTDEERHSYAIVPAKDDLAKEIGCGGGSHKETWRMFSRRFGDWQDPEPQDFASRLEEDSEARKVGMEEPYEWPSWLRNQANYPQVIGGLFFPETDMSGLQEDTIKNARTTGNWNWLRRDANPFSPEDPPESYFYDEMMTWDLIKYAIKALTALEGQLMDDYVWLIENLDAFEDLKQHMLDDLQSISVK